MMNKNTAILDNTMMDAYLTVTEGVSDNCGIGLAFCKPARERKEELCQPEQPPRCQCKLCLRLIFSNLPVEDSPSFLLQLLPHCNMN